MKCNKKWNKMFLLAMSAITLAFGLVLAGCDNGNGGGGDTTPPAEVSGLTPTIGDRQVVLNWTDPTDSDFAKVLITFSPTTDGVTQPITVLAGTTTATISGLTNSTEYTFTVKTVDTTGNTSAGETATATPAPVITYTVTVDGDVLTASAKIDFVFGEAVTGLTAGDITIAGTPGAAGKGALTGSGTNWSLALTVTTPGAATVAINKAGIESGAKPITLYGGLTFTAVSDNGSLYGATYGGGTFVVVGGGLNVGRILTSTDGVTWTPVTQSAITKQISGVTYGGTTFVVVGGTTDGKIATSADNGANWTPRTPAGSNIFTGVTYGNGTFVAVGQNGTIEVSANNGVNWTAATSHPFSSSIFRSVTYGGTTFVAVGANGTIAYSTDNGANWTAATTTASGFGTDYISGVSYGGGKFVAVGGDGKIAYSNPQE